MEGLFLKLKLMQRANSLGNTLVLRRLKTKDKVDGRGGELIR